MLIPTEDDEVNERLELCLNAPQGFMLIPTPIAVGTIVRLPDWVLMPLRASCSFQPDLT